MGWLPRAYVLPAGRVEGGSLGRGGLGVTALGKHCREQDDEAGAREPFQEPGTPAQKAIPAAAGLLGPEQEGVCWASAPGRQAQEQRGQQCGAAFPQKGGLRGASGGVKPRPRGPGTWQCQPCHMLVSPHLGCYCLCFVDEDTEVQER